SGSSAPATYAELDTSRVIGRALQTTVSDVTILKFGGTSVADAAAFTRVVTIVRRHGGPRPVVVVSALAGMTDALFAGAAAAAEGDVARARGIVDEQLARHDGVGRALLQGDAALPFQDQLAHARDELTGLLDRLAGRAEQPAALQDEIVSYGERLSASLLAAVLTADPRVVPGARPIPRLSYAEAAELAYFGAKVLHPKTIEPATARRIPVRICNSLAPDDPGTVVAAEPAVWPGAVKAIAHKTGITVLQIASTRMLGAYGFLRALFEVFDRHRTVVDVVTTSEVSVSLTLEDARALPAIVSELRALGEVSVEPHRAIVCVVGEGLRTTPGIAARIFTTIQDINVSLISQGASRVNLTFVVAEDRVYEAVRRLHEACFERERASTGGDAAIGRAAS